ncbi:PhzF family phenazine biosynthesis protein [Tengunoibacter tsumagoiensis]|uniref:Isomerase n=1 Tax=Tengunoibacter tsumagoiensis TaxID=2014871 RepID=A0A401ZZW3_9CHLR|nr:PhzF family phenazine biosynthesis protein [Tengunoibacter tsumagoiensis]GCE12395.1 isomerase [Tengunoibacter tsumagoiensis]
MGITIHHYAAFSTVPGKGNPAGIVFEADQLTAAQMQEIARRVGFNETAFLCQSTKADLCLRYFTPGHEMNLCGHATIAALYALKTKRMLANDKEPLALTIETKAGVLAVSITAQSGQVLVRMQQADAAFRPFTGSRDALASALGLDPLDLEQHLPVVYASTGTWTLLVPVRTLAAFQRMVPHNERFPTLLQEIPQASVHPFCLQTYDPQAHLHGRHFSSPFSGTREDPVTGTASGAMGAYYIEYIEPLHHMHLVIEQGHEIGHDGRVYVEVERSMNGIQVAIEGTALYETSWEL